MSKGGHRHRRSRLIRSRREHKLRKSAPPNTTLLFPNYDLADTAARGPKKPGNQAIEKPKDNFPPPLEKRTEHPHQMLRRNLPHPVRTKEIETRIHAASRCSGRRNEPRMEMNRMRLRTSERKIPRHRHVLARRDAGQVQGLNPEGAQHQARVHVLVCSCARAGNPRGEREHRGRLDSLLRSCRFENRGSYAHGSRHACAEECRGDATPGYREGDRGTWQGDA